MPTAVDTIGTANSPALQLRLDGRGERFRQVYRAMRSRIERSDWPSGMRLPTTRQWAQDLSLARKTIVAAYALLQAEGLIVARGPLGTYVAERAQATRSMPAPRALRTPPADASSAFTTRLRSTRIDGFRRQPGLRYDLHFGEPLANLGLFEAFSRSQRHAARAMEGKYPPAQGLPALREEVARYLARRRAVVCDADDIVIVGGTQQAATLLARILCNPGDAVLVEDPGYAFTAAAFALEGAAVTHVPIDSHGFPAHAVAALRPKVCVVAPAHQFPSGIVMPPQRREALLRAAAQAGTWVVEDDYDGDLGSTGLRHAALKSLDGEGRVFHVGSFSKTLFPGLRLAFVVPPRALRLDLVAAKAYLDLGCSSLDQAAVAHFMRSGAFERHLVRTAQELRRRRRLAIAALEEGLGAAVRIEDRGAPMHFIAWLPGRSEAEVRRLVEVAAARGLGLYSVAPHFHGAPPCAGLLVGVARLAPKQIPDAMRLLCACARSSFHHA